MLKRRDNNLDLVRLIASLAVIFGHSYYLFPANGHTEPFLKLNTFDNAGGLAVTLFFFISGILIPASFVNSRSVLRYTLMRVARLWPAAIVCLAVSAYLIGPALTKLPLGEYFRSAETHAFFTEGINFYKLHYDLPGVFKTNHYPNGVNGSMWTLPLELTCYLYVLVLGLVGTFASRSATSWACIGLIMLHLVAPEKLVFFSASEFNSEIRLAGAFALGTLAYANREHLTLDWRAAIGLFVLWLPFRGQPLGFFLFYIALFYAMLVLAASRRVRDRMKLPGDYSYGIYLYGFVIQQSVNSLFPSLGVFGGMALSLLGCVVLGWLSSVVIEQPAMRFAQWMVKSIPSALSRKSKASRLPERKKTVDGEGREIAIGENT